MVQHKKSIVESSSKKDILKTIADIRNRSAESGGTSKEQYCTIKNTLEVIYDIRQARGTYSFTVKEQEIATSNLRRAFSRIDREVVMSYNLTPITFMDRVGLVRLLLNQRIPDQVVYVSDYDRYNDAFKFRYFSGFPLSLKYQTDNGKARVETTKIRSHQLAGIDFINEYITWVQLSGSKKLKINSKFGKTRISFHERRYSDELPLDQVRKYFNSEYSTQALNRYRKVFIRIAKSQLVPSTYKGAWLLQDRASQADDNAEHLYRHITTRTDKTNHYFVLNKNSKDWRRLKEEGFKLVNFGSLRHQVLLINSDKIISSRSLSSIFRELGLVNEIPSYKADFIHLGHGINVHDYSYGWNNEKIDLRITGAEREFDSIVSDGNNYNLTAKEVALTGLPRHDALISGKPKPKNVILIMPTWRKHHQHHKTGKLIEVKNDKDFKNTTYFKKWNELLSSDKLADLLNELGFDVWLFLHPDVQSYISNFRSGNRIKIIYRPNSSMQQLFRDAAMMITDYSSVAFEMAYLRRPVVYFQFDRRQVYGGGNPYVEGYFDYQKDGFGPVCLSYHDVIKVIGDLLLKPSEVSRFINRAEKFFAFHDTNNSRRVLDTIKKNFS